MIKRELVDRARPLKVFVGDSEREQLRNLAEGCGLSLSAYLRQVGLGYQPRAIIDHQGVMELMRCRGEIGRLGGLLKLWLSEHDQAHEMTSDIRSLLHRIEDAELEIRQKVRSIP